MAERFWEDGRIMEEINKEDLKFLLQKELRNSDVSALGRIVIPKKEAEAHLPPLSLAEGIGISMVDMDTLQTWKFRYRFWPNNKSRMYILEKTGEFVKSHALERGDSIMVYKDNTNGIYVIKGKKASTDEDALGNSRERNGLCSSLNVIKGGNQQSAHDMDYKEIINKSSFNVIKGGNQQSAHDMDYKEIIGKSPYQLPVEALAADAHAFLGAGHFLGPGTYFEPGNSNSPKLESIPGFGPDDMDYKEIIDKSSYQLPVEDVAAYTHAFIGANHSTVLGTFATELGTYFQPGNPNSPKLESIPSFGPDDTILDDMNLEDFQIQ